MTKILTVSDTVADLVYSPLIAERFGDVDLVLSCGDLPIEYLEYIVSMLNKPLYYVRGNHAQDRLVRADGTVRVGPEGCSNIHRKVIDHDGLLIGGLEGSMRYRDGPHQYTPLQMELMVTLMFPRLYWNTLHYGRPVDIFVTHAPPLGIHDGKDLCHRGFDAFIGLMDRYRPQYLIHGHTHLYRRDAQRVTQYGDTTVLNTYGFQVIEIDQASRAHNRGPSVSSS